VPALVASLQEDSHSPRIAAIEALGRLGDESAVPELRALLGRKRPDGAVTDLDMTVMTALVRLRDTPSLEHIGDLLADFRSGTYGGDVYEELARYGEEGVQVLLRILNSGRRSSTQSEAAKALDSIRRPDVVNALKVWRRKQ
jgi:HEAT repeat protein